MPSRGISIIPGIMTTHTVVNPASLEHPSYRWFAEARFGMFIHFSLASMFGEDFGYQIAHKIPYRDYEAHIARFNPTGFRAADWVGLAAEAGCRYITLVAKHIEGFCLWNTKTTDWNITQSPFRRDLVGELAEECRRQGLTFCVYLNEDDWHSRYKPSIPGNWGDRDWHRDDDDPDWDKHAAYLQAQLTELLTQYGPIGTVWFDGSNKTEKHWRGRQHYEHIKKLQPDCLVNDRAGWGDFVTPEWGIHEAERLDSSQYLTEFCVSIYGNGWGYVKNAWHRSGRECIDTLVRCAGNGVNLLLNVAPDGNGVISTAQADRLRAMGAWLKIHGDAIYATEPLKLLGLPDTMRATRRGNDVYLLLRDWPKLDRLEVPGIHTVPENARLIIGGPHEGVPLQCRLKDGALVLDGLPVAPPDANARVIHLRFVDRPRTAVTQPALRTRTILPVSPTQPTLLPVAAAQLDGLAVKGWRHCVRKIQPPDAALEQPAKELPVEADQPYDAGPQPERLLHAILDWRRLEQSTTWTLDLPVAVRVRVRVLQRCAATCAGSLFIVQCGDTVLTGHVAGVKSATARVMPDWWKGFYWLPFTWQEVGELTLPAGQVKLTMQPIEIPWGCFFADVMALDLTPTTLI